MRELPSVFMCRSPRTRDLYCLAELRCIDDKMIRKYGRIEIAGEKNVVREECGGTQQKMEFR